MSSFAAPHAFPFGGDGDAPTVVITTIDHVAIALARLRAQYRSGDPQNLTNWEKLAAALVRPFNELELAFQQLLLLRSIDVATGVWEDQIGAIVGQPRNGLGNSDYRRFLFARVAANKSSGKRRDLIKVAKLVLNNSASRVQVITQPIKTAIVRILNLGLTDGLAAILFDFLQTSAAAGERIILESSPDDIAESFAFPAAAFASGALSIGATTIPVGSTADFPAVGTIDIDTGLAVAETATYAGKTLTSFLSVSTLAHNHTTGCVVQLVEPSTGKGFGNSSDPGQPNLVAYSDVGIDGGTLADLRG